MSNQHIATFSMEIRELIYKIVEPQYNSNDNKWSRVYDWVMLVAIIIGIIPLMFREHYKLFFIFDIVSCALFIIDYILRWMTADYRFRKKSNAIASFAIYPFTPMAIIDLLSILPTFNYITNAFKLTRVVRLLKIIRVVKIIRYFAPLRLVVATIKAQKAVLATVLGLAFFYVFLTALIMFNAEQPINPETGELLFNTFFDAFYWAACTLTTVGYGDIYPISTTGRIISIISSVVGIAIIALPSGIITAGYMEEAKKLRNENIRESNEDNESI